METVEELAGDHEKENVVGNGNIAARAGGRKGLGLKSRSDGDVLAKSTSANGGIGADKIKSVSTHINEGCGESGPGSSAIASDNASRSDTDASDTGEVEISDKLHGREVRE
jgi:hypothetical protein